MIGARWLYILLLLLGAGVAHAAPALTAAQVPCFQVRLRVVDGTGANQFALAGDKAFIAKTQRDAWSDWLSFGPDQADAVLKQSPNLHTKAFPLLVRLSIGGQHAPLTVEAELKLAGSETITPLRESLLGPTFTFALWRDADTSAHADTLAGYNRRTIWSRPAIAGSVGAPQPRQLPIIDRFIGGSDDIDEWREGTTQLLQHGANTLLFDAPTAVRNTLRSEGLTRISGAVYAPPESPFAFPIKPNSVRNKTITELLDEWAGKLAKPYRNAGYDPKDIVLYHLADEPGWYYPAAFAALRADAAGMARFHRYLAQQRLRPSDLGAKTWDDVLPIGISQAKDLPHRRLFYWTMQFFPWESANYYAASTAAMERAFRPGLPNPVNWNFFSARSYVPGPVANNSDKLDPDAAMGGHDWFEFARLRGSTMLWTEDWFSDAQAYEWSFQAARLNSAARAGGIAWGAYVVPRTSGETEFGLMQKVLSVVGNGGKALEYFTFGPEYNFPGNCYSPRAAAILPKMSRVHTMLAKADALLWPGRKPQAQVAILQPRSSEVWDPLGVSDATNNDLNRLTVDYMAEIHDLYRGLQQLNIPTDFVAEDGLTPQQLRGYKVLFATEPDFPREYLDGLLAWVRAGGTLVTVGGALSADRYNDPMPALQPARGIEESPHTRLWLPNADLLPKSGTVDSAWTVYGGRTAVHLDHSAQTLARFDDATPAIAERRFGRGRFVHYAFFPGLSAQVGRDKTSQTYPAVAQKWIGYPLQVAGVEAPVRVDRDGIETPLLQSPAGATITLLDWRGHDDDAAVRVTARLGFSPKSVESVTRGALEFAQDGDAITFALPLRGADIVLLRK